MTKYEPLGYYLDHSDALQITLSFKDIEKIIGVKLPDSAKAHREWWSNHRAASSRQSEAWVGLGWQVFHVDTHRQEVTFTKYKVAAATAG